MTFIPAIVSTAGRLSRAVAGGALGLLLTATVALPALTPTPAAAQNAAPDAAPEAAPALWVVRDADSTLYLFGSVHVLKPGTDWRTDRVDQAFAAAQDVWFELTNPDDAAAAVPFIQRHGVSRDRPLSSRLSAEDFGRLDVAARAIGASAAQMDPMRPWFAAMNLTMSQLIQAGFQPGTGVDLIMLKRAREEGKDIHGFETMDQQLGIFAGLDEATEMSMLQYSLDGFEHADQIVDGMVLAWRTGDTDGLDRVMHTEWKADFPAVYDALLTQRNIDWANQIQERLKGSGVTMVIVGAGHLVGSDSVQAQLAQRGITATRVE
ncbi:MAG TPA: TraB/GumN family protein [Brevundimonas sp.]|uniref:TraB/GumN family protein n=1 Tax=Brevundimonas sp. TaxID=1871086 RepID=UPI002632D026|nr:TraB/GumN family protein [Brevundimonas sp.]HRO32217.1 TraB/GumN family protein [Brevundimonas sp.]